MRLARRAPGKDLTAHALMGAAMSGAVAPAGGRDRRRLYQGSLTLKGPRAMVANPATRPARRFHPALLAEQGIRSRLNRTRSWCAPARAADPM